MNSSSTKTQYNLGLSGSGKAVLHFRRNSRWNISNNVFARGHAHYEGEAIDFRSDVSIFEDTCSKDEFLNTVDELNGFYAVIFLLDGSLYAAVDHLSTIPLFFSQVDETVYLSDDPYWVQEVTGDFDTPYDQLAEIEYLFNRFPSGSKTLSANVKQLIAGQYLRGKTVNGSLRVSTNRYYHHTVQPSPEVKNDELFEKLDEALLSSFKRLVSWAGGRPIVVSLSGGNDSRLVVLMLKRLEYDNIMAYTTDVPIPDELEVGRQVAQDLDIPWEGVRQTHEDWREFYRSTEWEEFHRTAGTLACYPPLVDTVAVKKMKEEDKLPSDPIIVPGHTASDFGKWMPKWLYESGIISEDELVKAVMDHRHYDILWDWKGRDLKKRLQEEVIKSSGATDFPLSTKEAIEAYETWRWQERVGKLVRGQLRTYDYHGFDWSVPLLDMAHIQFWNRVPPRYKTERSLYKDYVEELYQRLGGIDGSWTEITVGESMPNPFVSTIGKIVSGTPLEPPAQWIYEKYRWYDTKSKEYDRDPRYGVMSREQFDQLYIQREKFWSFLVLDAVGRISFDPPINDGLPKNGKLRLESGYDRLKPIPIARNEE